MLYFGIRSCNRAYSLYLARKGYDVTAVELSERNISVLKSNMSKDTLVEVIKGNVLDLNFISDKSFDAASLFLISLSFNI